MGVTTGSARLGIGALSKRTGCNIETIRYYERIGLMPHATRTEGGHRLYGKAHARRLGFIRRGRELGFTLDQVRTLFDLVDGDRYTCAQVKRITVHHLDEVRQKVVVLRKIERVLKEMADQCDGGTVPECPVIDALFDQESETVPGSIGLAGARRPTAASSAPLPRTAAAHRVRRRRTSDPGRARRQSLGRPGPRSGRASTRPAQPAGPSPEPVLSAERQAAASEGYVAAGWNRTRKRPANSR